MARRNLYLTDSFHEKGQAAVNAAHDQFDELMSMPIPDAIKAAKSLPKIFTEALVIGNQNPQSARDRLRSHFYVNKVIDVNRLFTYASRKIRTYALDRITLFDSARKYLEPINAAFKGISKPVEPQSLSVEIDLMLKNILAAHAPTAAKERSSLQAVTI
jgi:hypothetical protein